MNAQAAPVQMPVRIQTQPSSTAAGGVLQRKCACGNHTVAGGECERCLKKANGVLQRASMGAAPMNEVPYPLEHLLNTETQTFMEARFEHNFSGVQVYHDAPPIIQYKLTINQPGDRYEQEADHVADRVIRMSVPAQDKITPRIEPLIQRQMDDEVEDLEEEDLEEEEKPLQKKENGSQTLDLKPNLVSRIETLHGGGQPLSQEQRMFFEPRFGYDFSQVRIHTSSHAAETASRIGARAYTIGQDVVFGAGQYAPQTSEGQRLLAHELTHVIQQSHLQVPPSIQQAPEKPAGNIIVKIEIYLEEEIVILTTQGGQRYHVRLVRKESNVPAGKYKAKHTKGKSIDTLEGISGSHQWRWVPDPKAPVPDIKEMPSSEYDLFVYGSFQEESEGEGASGKGKVEGAGGKKERRKLGKGGKQEGADKAGTSGGKALLDEFAKALKGAGVGTKGVPGKNTLDLLKLLNPAERKDLVRYLSESYKETGEAVDFEKFAEYYKNLTQSERELLRVNLELSSSETAPTSELPSEIKLALEVSATTSAGASEKMSQLNKKLEELQRIHAKVTDETLLKKEKANLDPIDLAELPVFNEMMMLEGLLAGASARSPDIESIAKQLTKSISEIRSYILEEVTWLTTELAVGSIISALLAPVSAGVSVAASSARAVLLIRRLNKLREFLQKVEAIYSTYQTIQATIIKVTGLMNQYQKFQGEYERWIGEWESIKAKLDAVNLEADIEEQLSDELEQVEGLLIDKVQNQLDSGTGLGALMDHFYIPDNVTEEELKEILFNIPRGVEAMKELIAFYRSGKRGDIEFTKTLAFKATRAGVLLYPFVGYLAMQVSNQLGSLMREKGLGERLLGIVGRAAAKGPRWKAPGRAKNRAKLKSVKKKVKKETPIKEGSKKTKSKEKEKKKEKTKPGETKGDDKKTKKDDKDTALKASEWQKVVAKVGKLKDKYKSKGATKAELKKEARSIRKQHKIVANAPRVSEESNRGYWRVRIPKKGAAGVAAEAEVLMSIRTRWKKGKEAIEEKIAQMSGDHLKRTDIQQVIAPMKDDFGYTFLKVTNRQDKKQGFIVLGKMDQDKEREISVIDDITDLHFGTEDDPIPVHWYKHKGNYPKQISLTMDGKTQKFSMDSSETVELQKKSGTEQIQVGIDMKNLIEIGDVIKRNSKHSRSGTKQANYRQALERHDYQWGNKDADHVKDLGFEGKDDYDNLWPLDSNVNRWAYTGKWYRNYGIEYRDEKNPRQSLTSTLYRLVGKFFKVIGFKTRPRVLGGRTNKWKSPKKS